MKNLSKTKKAIVESCQNNSWVLSFLGSIHYLEFLSECPKKPGSVEWDTTKEFIR